ncbi:MAG: tyrosine-type recombinase/integrase [bacterium]
MADAGGLFIRLYDLRHTSATILLKEKVSPKIVQERLGHSTITLTMDTYSHVLEGMQEAATEAMESALVAQGRAEHNLTGLETSSPSGSGRRADGNAGSRTTPTAVR